MAHGYDAAKIVHTADDWYQSIGFAPLPATFWARSMIMRPRDREVVCHASAWRHRRQGRSAGEGLLQGDRRRLLHRRITSSVTTCTSAPTTLSPILFQGGANDGFHEAIGDFAALNALTPDYLKQLGLIDAVPGPEADIPYLLRMALDKIAFLPFASLVDKWRWEVFSGEITPEHYNEAWWELVDSSTRASCRRDRGRPTPSIPAPNSTSPTARPMRATSWPTSTSSSSTAPLAGWPAGKARSIAASIYGNKEVGAKFDAMLKIGQSKPWPEALAAFTGEHDIDASAIIDYFAPLSAWLDQQNAGRVCTR